MEKKGVTFWTLLISALEEKKAFPYKFLRLLCLTEQGFGRAEADPEYLITLCEKHAPGCREVLPLIRERLYEFWDTCCLWAVKTARRCREEGCTPVNISESLYPALLREVKDAPLTLYTMGKTAELGRIQRRLAVVGSRRMTSYGERFINQEVAKLIPYGTAIVSGMARGCDSKAHEICLEKGGFTVACLAHGLDLCYPPEHKTLKEEIKKKGLLISEYPPGTAAKPYYFPARNRLISGLCEACFIVEAGCSSGSLITADLACEQGREVGVLAASVFKSSSAGCNDLIREGARPVFNYQDLLDLLGLNKENRAYEHAFDLSLPPILKAISAEPLSEMEISCKLDIPLRELRIKLLEYESEGRIRRSRGRIFLTRA